MNVGITGHQDLGNALTIAWIEKEIENELDKLTIEKSYSSLAAGADQLFATIALRKNIPLIAVIPSYYYEETFSKHTVGTYRSLLAKAFKTIQLENEKPTESAFYHAGVKIVDDCDIMFAVWNNKLAKGLGGTADIVEYALLQKKQLIHFNPVTLTTSYILHP